MSKISRPQKEGGFTQYSDKVAAGFTAIIDQEVDNDLNTIYTDYGGHIDDNNIAKNALVGSYVLAPHSVTQTELAANLSFGTSNLADLSVTLPKLAYGATVFDIEEFGAGTAISIPFNTEVLLAERTFNVRNTTSQAFAIGTMAGWMPVLLGQEITFTLLLRLDGTPGVADGGALSGHSLVSKGYTGEAPIAVPLVQILSGLSAGQHRVKMTASVDALAGTALTYQLFVLAFP